MDKKFKLTPGKVLATLKYDPVVLDKGYAGQTLTVDVSRNAIEAKPVTEQMKEIFVGGKGFDLKLLWDLVNEKTRWDSPENAICISSGPLGGTTSYPGSGKSLVTAISPLTNIVVDCNVGGHFGPFLKFSGWDALAVTGKAKKDVLIIINGREHEVTIQEMKASNIDSHILCDELTKYYSKTEEDKRYISIVASGSAAEHTYFGLLNFSFWDWHRREIRIKQAGRGGIGTVMRDKKILAIVAFCDLWKPKWTITIG